MGRRSRGDQSSYDCFFCEQPTGLVGFLTFPAARFRECVRSTLLTNSEWDDAHFLPSGGFARSADGKEIVVADLYGEP